MFTRFCRIAAISAVYCFLGATASSRAEDTPSTQPSSQPSAATWSARPDLSNPRAALLSYDAESDRGPQVLARYYVTHDEDEKALVRSQARADAMLGILEELTEKKWGTDGMNTVLHAFNFDTRTDIQDAQITIDGDRAKVICTNDQSALELIKTEDGWKIDATALKHAIGMPVEDYMAMFQSMSPIISDMADGIANDKWKTPAAAAEEAQRRIKAIGQ
jgi:hypothetical protein